MNAAPPEHAKPDLVGAIDLEQKTVQPLDNPFGTRLSPMSPVRPVTYVSGPDIGVVGSAGRIRTYDQPVNSRLLYH
jgi:hypothetical protein